MNSTSVVHAIFPIPIYTVECDIDITSAVRFLNQQFDFIPNNYSSTYGNKTVDDYLLDHPECESLKNFAIFHFERFARDVFAWDIEGFQITQSWITVKNPGEMHGLHYHPNSVLSGVFYFQENAEQTAPLTFHRPEPISQLMNMFAPSTSNELKQYTEFPWHEYSITPKTNLLVLFPSWLNHSVGLNNTSTARRSIAMNALPIKKFGSRESSLEIDFSRLK